MPVNLEITCDRCGSNGILIPIDGNDASELRCIECGHDFATLGEVKRQVEEALLNQPSSK